MLKKCIMCLLGVCVAVFFVSEIYCEEPSGRGDKPSDIELLKEELEKLKAKIQALGDEAKARKTLQVKAEEKTGAKRAEEILRATAERYSLLKTGHLELQYTLDYAYLANDILRAGSGGSLSVLHSKEHTFTNALRANYGIIDNLSFDVRFPFVYKYEKVSDNNVTDLGDISLGLQYQPFKKETEWPTMVLSTGFETNSGVSPWEIDLGEDLSTGSGNNAVWAGINISKVIDPVVLFGSLSYNYEFEESDLWQKLGNDQVLVKVAPGDSIGYSLGLGYSLSYNISLIMQFQQGFTDYTYYWLDDGTKIEGETQTTAMLFVGSSIRMTRNTILYVNVGMGLTEDSPDFLLNLRLPFEFAVF